MTYIIPHEGCRLGNWLYYYAAAVSNGDGEVAVVDNGVDTRSFLLKYQKSFFKDVKLVDQLPENAVIWEEDCMRLTEMPEIKDGQCLALHGFFQKLGYLNFKKIVPRLRMSPGEESRYWARYGDWLRRPNVTAIHVRRGDYLSQQYSFPFVGKAYFRRAITRLSETDDFMVFSDDIPWCKQFFVRAFPDKNFCFVQDGDLIDDFRLQTLCRHNVISNSSYSWWAARLNVNEGHRMLAPSYWRGYFGRAHGSDGAKWLLDGMEVVPNGDMTWRRPLEQWQYFRYVTFPRVKHSMRNCLKY